jgi:hypothetical protein
LLGGGKGLSDSFTIPPALPVTITTCASKIHMFIPFLFCSLSFLRLYDRLIILFQNAGHRYRAVSRDSAAGAVGKTDFGAIHLTLSGFSAKLP